MVAFEVRNEQAERVLKDIGRALKDIMPPNFGFTLLLTSYGDDHDLFHDYNLDSRTCRIDN